MKIDVLVTTMNQADNCLPSKMNIQTDVLIGNQCDHMSKTEFKYKNHNVTRFDFDERGVGLNRNNLLMRSSADICVLADDDMVFYDGYNDVILKAFAEKKSASMIIFNIDDKNSTKRRKNSAFKRVTLLNYMNYGAARIVLRRGAISYNSCYFNLNFGGGTQHSAGEDSLFIRECLKKRLKIYTAPYTLAYLNEDRNSTWFSGYTEKYFFDKGCFLGVAHPLMGRLFGLALCIKHPYYFEKSGMSFSKIIHQINLGISYIKRINEAKE